MDPTIPKSNSPTASPDIVQSLDAIARAILGNTAGLKQVDLAYAEYSAEAHTTASIPYDDTKPQVSEGFELMSKAIVPKSTTNILRVEVQAWTNASSNANVVGALFKDSTADAFAATNMFHGASQGNRFSLIGFVLAGVTVSTTLSFRIGTSAGTLTFNGEGSARFLGAVTKSFIAITEFKPQ